MAKILAIVVSYYPEKEAIIKNINSFQDDVDKILIWENTPLKDADSYRFVAESERIQYCGSRDNIGIPRALNYAWHYALQNSYDYLLIMDQDSEWLNFSHFLDETIRKEAKVGLTIWGPNTDISSKSCGTEELDYLITSGTLVSTSILNLVNGWPETFTIDCVDMDFCYNARSKGVHLLMVKDALMKQHFGTANLKRSFKNFKKKQVSSYSPTRLYWIVRNGIILGKKYRNFPTCSYTRGWTLNRGKQIILYEDNKLAKLLAIIRGLRDGIKYKF